MDVHLRLFLYLLPTAYTWAGPLSTASPVPLTADLVERIPTCAQPCLQAFVADSFPSSVCSSPSINCLCTSDSESGYTIGEGALSCLVSDCPAWDEDEAVLAYEICGNIAGAVSKTHSIITATHTAVTTVSGTVSTTSTSSTRHSTSTTSTSSRLSFSSPSSASAIASSTNSLVSAATGSASSTTTTPSSSPIIAAPASTSSGPPPKPILSKPQIAGIVVASIGAAALAFGLCFLLFCCRRRNQVKRYSGSSFGGGKVGGSSVDSTPDLAILAAREWGHDPEGKEVVGGNPETLPPRLSVTSPQTTGEGGWSQWRRNTAPQDIGLALAPGLLTSAHPSPVTPSSGRTRNSQLLPEKPSYSLFPPSTRPSPHSRRGSQGLQVQPASRNTVIQRASPLEVSNGRFSSPLDTSHTYMQGVHTSRSPSSPLQIFPHMHAARPQASYQPYREAPTPGPTESSHKSPGVLVRNPLPAHAPLSAGGLRLGQAVHRQYSSIRPPYPPLPPPLNPHHSGGAPTNTLRRKKSDSRPATWLSTGSETSFEDADADEPPEQVSALTPVNEQHSPITYPRIPTTAAESLTRRPQMPDRSASLLARRRGEGRAVELASRNQPRSSPSAVRQSAKSQILQSPVLSEPLATGSPSSNSPRITGRGAGIDPPPSGWPVRR